jgi:hypothetical protein
LAALDTLQDAGEDDSSPGHDDQPGEHLADLERGARLCHHQPDASLCRHQLANDHPNQRVADAEP